MKKITVTAIALSMAMAMTGCSGNSSETTAASEAETTAAETSAAETSAAETSAAETSAAEAGEVSVMSYEEYMAAELDSKVVIEASVQAKQSWWEDKATVYAQDEDGAYFLYNMACSKEDYEKLVPGATIQVTGYKTEWSGEVEIIDATFQIVGDGDTFVAEPLDVTELLGSDELIDHQNQLVSFQGLTVAPSEDASGNQVAFLYNYDGSGTQGDDLYFNVSLNGQTYTFTVESYLCDSSTEVYKAVEALQIGQVIDAEGFLYWYEGVNPHITSVTVAQ